MQTSGMQEICRKYTAKVAKCGLTLNRMLRSAPGTQYTKADWTRLVLQTKYSFEGKFSATEFPFLHVKACTLFHYVFMSARKHIMSARKETCLASERSDLPVLPMKHP